MKNLIGNEYRPFIATTNSENNVFIIDINYNNVIYKNKNGEIKKVDTENFLNSYININQ